MIRMFSIKTLEELRDRDLRRIVCTIFNLIELNALFPIDDVLAILRN